MSPISSFLSITVQFRKAAKKWRETYRQLFQSSIRGKKELSDKVQLKHQMQICSAQSFLAMLGSRKNEIYPSSVEGLQACHEVQLPS
ncbi:hypothetical protein AK812_SmicGene31029 [Symbiodinium microadriaticum]|uniref:Uncharacterized protein n=1 Tax=Symbiodinium microadriaticum TaxID=2951 RepID=A0A1Q9CXR1_SYMMI|nr:hypothetical protein AK812_SmicGene31029 [Symbiodinium microadriaticum]